MGLHENRESFILRWLDARGLLTRHDDLTPEDILTRERLEARLTSSGWQMFRETDGRCIAMEAPDGQARTE